MCLRFSVIALVLISVSVFGTDVHNLSDPVEDSMKAINTPMEALKRALDFTGFSEKLNRPLTPALADSIISKVVITDDQTPFFADSINNRELWLVKLDSINIGQRANPDKEEYGIFNFRVLLDPETGRILKVYNDISDLSKDQLAGIPRIPSGDEATRILKGKKIEYHSIPNRVPNITFYDALMSARRCRAPEAKIITGIYVMYSYLDEKPKPVWCITTRGILPISGTSFTDKAPEFMRKQGLCFVDATTGEWLLMTIAPY
jgi:hypothetical protein